MRAVPEPRRVALIDLLGRPFGGVVGTTEQLHLLRRGHAHLRMSAKIPPQRRCAALLRTDDHEAHLRPIAARFIRTRHGVFGRLRHRSPFSIGAQQCPDIGGFIDPPASVAPVVEQRIGIRFGHRRRAVEKALVAALKRHPHDNRKVTCRRQDLRQAAAVGGHDVLVALDASRCQEVREAPVVPVEQRQPALATLVNAGKTLSEPLIERLRHRHVAVLHGMVQRMPGRQGRQRVAHQGEAVKTMPQFRQ